MIPNTRNAMGEIVQLLIELTSVERPISELHASV